MSRTAGFFAGPLMSKSATTCRMMIEHNDLWITTLVMIMLITVTDEKQSSKKSHRENEKKGAKQRFYGVICCEGF